MLEGSSKRMVVEQEVITMDKQGMAAWVKVLIVSKGIASLSWIVSLFGAGAMGVYIASPILRYDSVGRQYIKITYCDSMLGMMKGVSNSLWDGGLCLLQGSFAFVLDATTRLITESS